VSRLAEAAQSLCHAAISAAGSPAAAPEGARYHVRRGGESRSQHGSGDALEVVDLTDVARRLTRTYSGGMLRRLELAQALVNRPRVLILDEPTLGLDPLARSGVWERVERLREELGMSVLLTTRYMDEADALCGRVSIMHHGRIRASGAPATLKSELGPQATLEDVFRHHAQDEGGLQAGQEEFRGVRGARRTGRRVG
jgi:ABC-2 type transport system ATP-binding protein